PHGPPCLPSFPTRRSSDLMDPYFVLPLLMGVSMFAQSLLSPAPADPMQAKIMRFMPVVMTVFFLWFPAGLVLYWLTNSVLGILRSEEHTSELQSREKLVCR